MDMRTQLSQSSCVSQELSTSFSSVFVVIASAPTHRLGVHLSVLAPADPLIFPGSQLFRRDSDCTSCAPPGKVNDGTVDAPPGM